MSVTQQPTPREGTVFHWPGDNLKYRDIDHQVCLNRTESIRKYHTTQKGYADIAYNIVVCPHGKETGGRGVQAMSGANGTETKNANSRWGSVLFLIGDGEVPTDAQYIAAEAAAVKLGGTDRKSHSDIRSTGCPGKIIKAWVDAGTPVIVPETKPTPKPEPKPTVVLKSITIIAHEVIDGKWGNGDDRIRRLFAAGYNPTVVQVSVNAILNIKPARPAKSVNQLAREVIAGHWGNGDVRAKRLRAAGYDPVAVQAEVNRLLSGADISARPKTARQVAEEVIRGEWGAGSQRQKRLQAAGYNYREVQNIVNRLLG